MSYFFKLMIIFIILFSTTIHAESFSSILVINEKNSALHFFQKNNNVIKEIFSAKDPSWKKLLENKRLSPNTHIKILATIPFPLGQVKKYAENLSLIIDETKVISEQTRGIYTWLAVNYAEGRFSKNHDTLGIIAVNAQDTLIAYATNEDNKDIVELKINDQTYHVFSKNFSGLGQDSARDKMHQNNLSGNCYPQGYQANSKFNFVNCAKLYTDIINSYQIKLPSHDNIEFVIVSGAYHTYNFFGVEDASQGALDARVDTICASTWEDMLREYEGDKYLAGHCANGAFLDQLFYPTFKLQPMQMWVTSKLHNGEKINWVLGAALELN